MTSVLSNLSFKLTGILSTSSTSVTVSNDIELNQVIVATNASVVLQNSTGTELERMVCDFAGGVMTIVYRGLDQSATINEVIALKKERRTGTTGYITQLAPDVLDINDTSAKILPGQYTFTGDNDYPLFKVYSYADETARDAAIPSPSDGVIIYNNDLEDYQYYKNGVRVTGFGAGSGGGGTWYKDSTEDGSITGAINGVNTTYTLSNTPGAVNSCIVVFNGVVMERDEDYTLVGATLGFTTAPVTGKIVAIYPTVSIGTSAALTRGTSDASAANGELYRSTNDSQSLYYKDNSGNVVKMPEKGLTTISAGVGDVGKVPLLDSTGKLDQSVISLGVFGDGGDGDLIVASGTTTLNAGQEYQYNNVTICTGATLAFTGCGGAIIRTKCNFTNAGLIELRGVLSQGAAYYDVKTKIAYCDCSTGIVSWNPGYGGLGTVNTGTPGNGGCSGLAGGNGCGGAAGGFNGTACPGENNLTGGGGGGGGVGTCALAGCPAIGNTGGAGGYGGAYCGSGGGQAGGGGGGGYDTGNGGVGGNGGSCFSSGYGKGGNGGNSGANDGCGGAGGFTGAFHTAHDVGKGGDGYINGGAGGAGAVCNAGGARGGNGYIGNGGAGGNGSTCAYGGHGGCGRNGGAGGGGGCGSGNGGNALHSVYGIVATVGCCFNNNGGTICAKGGNGGAGAVCGCGAHGGDVYILYKCNICYGTICNTGGTGTPAGCNGKLYFSKILGDA